MLIDTGITIAYKCSSCGTYEFFAISLFDLSQKKSSIFTCRCKKTGIYVIEDNAKNFNIKIPCNSCGNEHIFPVTLKGLLSNRVIEFCCPYTGMQQCFIGNDRDVRSRVDMIEKELDELINMFGYDNYFKNTQVMLDSLNKIHDIAEQGNLFCECGNNDISLSLLSDKIRLNCNKCSGSKIIYAASNEDLKNIMLKQHILLEGVLAACDRGNTGAISRKTE